MHIGLRFELVLNMLVFLQAVTLGVFFLPTFALAQATWTRHGAEWFVSAHLAGTDDLVLSSSGLLLRRTDGEQWKFASNLDGEFRDMSFNSSGVGLAAGANGLLLRTTNHGREWKPVVTSATGTLRSISWNSDSQVALLEAGKKVWQSLDAGLNWNPLPSPDSGGLLDVLFLDVLNGVAVGNQGRIYRTDDASVWQEVTTGVQSPLNGVFKTSATTLLAYGNSRTILRSTDRGWSWRVSQTPLDGPSSLFSITETANGTLVIGGSGSLDRKTYRSIDDGLTWQAVMIPGASSRDLVWSLASSGTRILAAGEIGFLAESTDDGVSWSVLADSRIDQTAFITAISPVTDQSLMAVGAGSSILRSSDRGLTWRYSQMANVVPELRDILFLDSLRGIVVGTEGKVYQTDDAGKTWVEDMGAPYHYFKHIYTFRDTLCLVSTQRLFVSTNAGLTWDTLAPINHFIHDALLSGDGRVCAVGSIGSFPDQRARISLSYDGGNSWLTQTHDSVSVFYGIKADGQGNLFALGSKGVLLRSTNFGNSWKRMSVPTESHLTDMGFLGDTVAIVCGTPGVLLESRDGGTTWESALLEREDLFGSVGLLDIRTTDYGAAYIVGNNMILKRGLIPDSARSIVAQWKLGNPFLELKLHPNPASTRAIVTINGLYSVKGQRRELHLFDAVGRHVFDYSPEVNRDLTAPHLDVVVNTDGLSAGTYFLVLTVPGSRRSTKIVKY